MIGACELGDLIAFLGTILFALVVVLIPLDCTFDCYFSTSMLRHSYDVIESALTTTLSVLGLISIRQRMHRPLSDGHAAYAFSR